MFIKVCLLISMALVNQGYAFYEEPEPQKFQRLLTPHPSKDMGMSFKKKQFSDEYLTKEIPPSSKNKPFKGSRLLPCFFLNKEGE